MANAWDISVLKYVSKSDVWDGRSKDFLHILCMCVYVGGERERLRLSSF